MRGLPRRTSEQWIAKSITIKGWGGKSGRCAVKAVELTSGGLPGVLDSGLSGSQGPLSARQESAAGILGRRRLKAQTERSGE
ncbi:MAG: hypothetical protein CBCREVIR_0298 [Candidatus Burkholderia crenata]|nr:MAG: hypothetical protein CBCREVIR_0298 [Candidatus Burkholderia crenata]